MAPEASGPPGALADVVAYTLARQEALAEADRLLTLRVSAIRRMKAELDGEDRVARRITEQIRAALAEGGHTAEETKGWGVGLPSVRRIVETRGEPG